MTTSAMIVSVGSARRASCGAVRAFGVLLVAFVSVACGDDHDPDTEPGPDVDAPQDAGDASDAERDAVDGGDIGDDVGDATPDAGEP